MFLHLSVILFTGVLGVHPWADTPPLGRHPLGRQPLGTPRTDTPQTASYWNAFLLQHDTELVSGHFCDKSNTLNGLIIVTSSFIFASDMKLEVSINIY